MMQFQSIILVQMSVLRAQRLMSLTLVGSLEKRNLHVPRASNMPKNEALHDVPCIFHPLVTNSITFPLILLGDDWHYDVCSM